MRQRGLGPWRSWGYIACAIASLLLAAWLICEIAHYVRDYQSPIRLPDS